MGYEHMARWAMSIWLDGQRAYGSMGNEHMARWAMSIWFDRQRAYGYFFGHRPHMSIGYKPPLPDTSGGGRPEKDVETEKTCRASFIIRGKQGIIAVPGDR